MGILTTAVSVSVFFGVGYLFLRSYWSGNDGLNAELFD